MGAFSGTLNRNLIQSGIFNMIISQEVFADNIGKHQTLVEQAKVDGGLFGDKKLYYATDCLFSSPWGNDAEAENLLALDRPLPPKVQEIVLDQFRQIRLTTDQYLSKQAFSAEGIFAEYIGVMKAWMNETKKIYEGTLYNVFIGTTESSIGEQDAELDLTSATTPEARAKAIAEDLANRIVAMGDYSRDFNDYGLLRSYEDSRLKVIWNSKYVNEIKKVDLPAIFHKEGLVDKFDEEVLPARYFGTPNTSAIAAASVTANTYRSTKEAFYGTATTSGSVVYHVMPGDYIPAGGKLVTGGKIKADRASTSANFGKYVADGAITLSAGIAAGDAYTEDATVMYKIVVKLPPMMSAFSVGTTFFNPRSLTENSYLTFGHNTLEYFKNYPFVTVKEDLGE